MTISRVKFPWPPFFRIFIFFDEVFNSVRGTTYLMRDDGATVVNVRSSRVIWSRPNPTDVLAQPRSGLRYVACTATQTSPDLPVCLRWLQEPSACTSSAQLLSRHLSRSSCTTAESDDQPCTWARLSTHETAAGGLCFRRASWTLLVAAPEARRGPTPDAVRAERGVTRLPLLEPRGSPSRGGRVPDGRVPIGQFDRPRTQ